MASLRATTRGLRLQADYVLACDEISAKVSLNDILGNEDGYFKLGSKNISATAKNLYVNGLILRAELLCSNGSWRRAEIDLNEAVFERKEIFPQMFAGLREYFERQDEWSGGAKMFKLFGTERAMRIVGDTLHVETQHQDGSWHPAEHDFSASYRERLRSRELQPQNVPGYFDPVEVVDTTTNATGETFISLEAQQPLKLLASCRQDDGRYDDFQLNLNDIVEGGSRKVLGKFVTRHLSEMTPWQPLRIYEPRLVGTILQARVQGFGGNLHQSSIDLEQVVANDGGMLVMKKSSPFCSACKNIFLGGAFHRNSETVVIPLEEPPKVIRRCDFCDFLRKGSASFAPAEVHSSSLAFQQSAEIKTVLCGQSYWLDQVEVLFRYRNENDPESYFEADVAQIYSIADHWEDSMHFRTLPKKRLPLNLSGDAVRRSELALQWIEHCTRRHDKCGSSQGGMLPSRIIKVDGGSFESVRLVNGNNMHRPYACLSYCWGGRSTSKSVDYILLKARLDDYQDRILLQSLPQTLQDAIEFARSIQIDYLWIDALCILQDDPLDWDTESSRMDEYYANCLVCLAATASASSSEGFQIPPRARIVISKGFGLDNLPFSIGLFPQEVIPRNVHFDRSVAPTPADPKFPLLSRGWAYQERRLAPRVLHFCRHEILFECSHGNMCECGGVTSDQKTWTKSWRPIINTVNSGRYQDSPRTVVAKSVDIWQADVTEFSARDLTYENDRLPGLSGLAKYDRVVRLEDSEWHRGRYLAGIWENHLPFDLMWRVGRMGLERPVEITTSRRVTSYIAPSWSWASTSAPVEFWKMFKRDQQPHDLCQEEPWEPKCAQFDLPVDGPLIMYHGAETVCAGEDPTGRVQDGYLDVTGHPVPSSWTLDASQQQPYTLCELKNGIFMPDYAIHVPGPGQISADAELVMLPIYGPIEYGQREDGVYLPAIFYLVLQRRKAKFRELPTYDRVGSAVGTYLRTDSDPWDHLPAVRESKASRLIIV